MRIQLARQYARFFPRDIFIGITGTVGKTTATQACVSVLSEKYTTLSTILNLDPVLNIPITLLKIKPRYKKVILEMGVEYPGEMDFYLSLVRPKVAIITRISYQHSEFLGDIERIFQEKAKLVQQLPKDGIAILNVDDAMVTRMADLTEAQVVYFGKDAKKATVWADTIRIENLKTVFGLNYGVERVEVQYPLLGEHQIYPALAAAALGISENLSLMKIKKGLEKITQPEHRLQPVLGPNGSLILDDTYNAAPISVEAAIDTLMQIPSRRSVLVLGEMRELGDFTDEMHRQIAQKVYKEKIDFVLLGQGDALIIEDELKKLGFPEDRLISNLQNSQIVSHLLQFLGKGDVCLVKGARAVRLDEVVKRVAKKG